MLCWAMTLQVQPRWEVSGKSPKIVGPNDFVGQSYCVLALIPDE